MKLAVIGLGSMGKMHLKVLREEKINVVAGCDPVVDDFFGLNGYSDVSDMLAKEELDGAIIASPTSVHFDVAKTCIQAGLPILVEKPVCSTVDQAEQLLNIAGDSKVVVGHSERFNPVIQTLKAQLAGKTIQSLLITRIGPFPARIMDVGILTDLSVHDTDLVRFLSEQEIKDVGINCSRKVHPTCEDNAVLNFKMADDTVATVVTNWHTPFRKRVVEVATTDGYYVADLLTQDLKVFKPADRGGYQVNDIFVAKGQPLAGEHKSFIQYIESGDLSGLAKIEDSLETLRVIS